MENWLKRQWIAGIRGKLNDKKIELLSSVDEIIEYFEYLHDIIIKVAGDTIPYAELIKNASDSAIDDLIELLPTLFKVVQKNEAKRRV